MCCFYPPHVLFDKYQTPHTTPLFAPKYSFVGLGNLVDLLENLRPVVREELVLLGGAVRVEQAMESIGIESQDGLCVPLNQRRGVARRVDDGRRLAGVLAVAVAHADVGYLLVPLLCVLEDDDDVGNVKVPQVRVGAGVEEDLAACLTRHDALGVGRQVLHVVEALALVGAAGRLVDEDAVDGDVRVRRAPPRAPLSGVVGVGRDVGLDIYGGLCAEADVGSSAAGRAVRRVHVAHGADVGVLVQRGDALDEVPVRATFVVDGGAVRWVDDCCEGDVGVLDGRVCQRLPEAERIRVNVQREEDICVSDGHGARMLSVVDEREE